MSRMEVQVHSLTDGEYSATYSMNLNGFVFICPLFVFKTDAFAVA